MSEMLAGVLYTLKDRTAPTGRVWPSLAEGHKRQRRETTTEREGERERELSEMSSECTEGTCTQ